MSDDTEIEALHAAYAALRDLPVHARERCIEWLASRLESDAALSRRTPYEAAGAIIRGAAA